MLLRGWERGQHPCVVWSSVSSVSRMVKRESTQRSPWSGEGGALHSALLTLGIVDDPTSIQILTLPVFLSHAHQNSLPFARSLEYLRYMCDCSKTLLYDGYLKSFCHGPCILTFKLFYNSSWYSQIKDMNDKSNEAQIGDRPFLLSCLSYYNVFRL